jgi:hypothetical protein
MHRADQIRQSLAKLRFELRGVHLRRTSCSSKCLAHVGMIQSRQVGKYGTTLQAASKPATTDLASVLSGLSSQVPSSRTLYLQLATLLDIRSGPILLTLRLRLPDLFQSPSR